MKENGRISLFKLLFIVCFVNRDHMWYLLQWNFLVGVALLLAFGAFCLFLKEKRPEFLQFSDWNFMVVHKPEGHGDNQGACVKYNTRVFKLRFKAVEKNLDPVIPSLHFIFTQAAFYR